MRTATSTLTLATAFLLTGCVLTESFDPPVMPDEVRAADPDAVAAEAEEELAIEPPTEELPEVVPIWTPAWWDEPLDVAFAPMSLVDLLPLLAKGHLVVFANDVIDEWAVPVDAAPDSQPPTVRALPAQAFTRGQAIEHLCIVYDLWCDYTGGPLKIAGRIVRTYDLSAQPGQSQGSMGVEGLSQSTGQSSATMTNDPYASTLEPLVQLVLESRAENQAGGGFVLSAETNTLTVDARISVHNEIESLVKRFNRRFALGVRVHISIFEIERNKESGFRLRPEYSPQPDAETRNTIAGVINESIENSRIDVTYRTMDLASSFVVALNALASISHTDVVFSETLETRNNVIITSQNTRNESYVRSLTRNRQVIGQNLEDSWELEFEDLETGWSVSALPTVGIDNVINIRVAISRNDLVGRQAHTVGAGASYNTFTTDQTSRQMAVTLRDGQSRLVSALATEQTENGAGVLSKDSRKTATEFAILVSASVVDPVAEQLALVD